ncbi:MAG: DUF748 domain-containing protein [Deltaproteobacteria bacterium]|nr:DUF748 domain-containing protein [Deltaproteobacteria bacterium]
MIKFIKRIFLAFTLLIIITAIGIYLFVPIDKIAKDRLEDILGRDFSIGRANVAFAHLEINDLTYKDSEHKIQDVIKIKDIKVYPSLLLLLTGRVVIKNIEIDSPYLLLRRFNDNKWSVSKLFGGSGSAPIILKGIEIKNGTLDIWDDKAGKMPFKTAIDGLKINIYNPIAILGHGTVIDISGRLKQGGISIKGDWDPLTYKLAADAKANAIDMTIANPYLADEGGVIITSGSLDLSSKIKFENNIVNAPVDAVVKELKMKSAEGVLLDISVPLVISLIEKQGKFDLRFNIYGHLNNIQTNLKDALKKKAEDSLEKKIESPLKKLGRDLKDIGKGIMDVFR